MQVTQGRAMETQRRAVLLLCLEMPAYQCAYARRCNDLANPLM
jgi:hypothetical protein